LHSTFDNIFINADEKCLMQKRNKLLVKSL
jgi:hypothetical protein